MKKSSFPGLALLAILGIAISLFDLGQVADEAERDGGSTSSPSLVELGPQVQKPQGRILQEQDLAAFSWTIVVRDEANGAPIPGVRATLKQEGNPDQFSQSDDKGIVGFSAPGECHLGLTCYGYIGKEVYMVPGERPSEVKLKRAQEIRGTLLDLNGIHGPDGVWVIGLPFVCDTSKIDFPITRGKFVNGFEVLIGRTLSDGTFSLNGAIPGVNYKVFAGGEGIASEIFTGAYGGDYDVQLIGGHLRWGKLDFQINNESIDMAEFRLLGVGYGLKTMMPKNPRARSRKFPRVAQLLAGVTEDFIDAEERNPRAYELMATGFDEHRPVSAKVVWAYPGLSEVRADFLLSPVAEEIPITRMNAQALNLSGFGGLSVTVEHPSGSNWKCSGLVSPGFNVVLLEAKGADRGTHKYYSQELDIRQVESHLLNIPAGDYFVQLVSPLGVAKKPVQVSGSPVSVGPGLMPTVNFDLTDLFQVEFLLLDQELRPYNGVWYSKISENTAAPWKAQSFRFLSSPYIIFGIPSGEWKFNLENAILTPYPTGDFLQSPVFRTGAEEPKVLDFQIDSRFIR